MGLMNAKQLALRHGMLSVDEVDLIQKCVTSLQEGAVFDIGLEEWQGAKEEWEREHPADFFGIPEVIKFAQPKPITIVNIGANVGTSSCAMLEANPNAFIFSIDPKPWPEEEQNIIACGLDHKRVVRLLGRSQEFQHFPYDVDMVFVDGGHTDKDVTGDIEVWKPKCKQVMLFHDYHHPNYAKKPGVNLDDIVDEAMKDWERIGEARYLVAFRKNITAQEAGERLREQLLSGSI